MGNREEICPVGCWGLCMFKAEATYSQGPTWVTATNQTRDIGGGFLLEVAPGGVCCGLSTKAKNTMRRNHAKERSWEVSLMSGRSGKRSAERKGRKGGGGGGDTGEPQEAGPDKSEVRMVKLDACAGDVGLGLETATKNGPSFLTSL